MNIQILAYLKLYVIRQDNLIFIQKIYSDGLIQKRLKKNKVEEKLSIHKWKKDWLNLL